MIAYRYQPPGPLGFGGAPLGNMFEAVSEPQAEAALTTAYEQGIRYFDTAPYYGYGLSEHRFGHALRGFDREEFALSTKVGRVLHPDGPQTRMFVNALPFKPVFDYTYDGAMRSFEDSLQRLGLPSIDIVYIHDIAADAHGAEWNSLFETAMSGAAVALTKLRQERVIRAWGLGVNLPEPCFRALDAADPDIFLLAGRYTLLDQSGAPLLAECERRGVSIVVGGPFNSGLLAGGTTFEYADAPRDMAEKRAKIAEICERFGVDIRAAALQFSKAHPAVAAVIPGSKTPEKVAELTRLISEPIDPALWAALREAGVLAEDAVTPKGPH
jgi:D-threo-aldose 1-dehydrogenase